MSIGDQKVTGRRLIIRSRFLVVPSLLLARSPQQAFATPDADDSDVFGIASIHDTEGWVNQLPQERLIEFRYDAVRVPGEFLDAADDFRHEVRANVGSDQP